MNLNELIETAIKYDACENSINRLKKYETFEEAIQDKFAPSWCYWYTWNVIKGRWEPGEKVILKSSAYSYMYALNIIKGRWEPGEPIIFKNDYYKQEYCNHFNIIE